MLQEKGRCFSLRSPDSVCKFKVEAQRWQNARHRRIRGFLGAVGTMKWRLIANC
jgi:hypothetical protein